MIIEQQTRTELKYRHCANAECGYWRQGRQVPCRLRELDLLHGREKLTDSEVLAGQTEQGAECRYHLLDDGFAQSSASCRRVMAFPEDINSMSPAEIRTLWG